MRLMHANVLTPPMFIEHDPQMPSRHERRNVNVGSISFLIFNNASSTMGAHSFRSIWYFCKCGFSFGFSGFHRYISNVFNRGCFFGWGSAAAAPVALVLLNARICSDKMIIHSMFIGMHYRVLYNVYLYMDIDMHYFLQFTWVYSTRFKTSFRTFDVIDILFKLRGGMNQNNSSFPG